MKKLDKLGWALNIVFSVLYVPLSLFSWLLMMASEGAIGATNPLYINLIELFCVISFIIPLLCMAGIFLSVVLRRKGYSILSFVIQFLPLVVFVLNFLLLAFAESLPARI